MNDTSERITPGRQVSLRQHLLYLRHLFSYEYAANRIRSDTRTLEVGCGEGYGVALLSRSIDSLVGLDVDGDAIRHAAEKYPGPNCRFEAYDGVRIPFPDGHFGSAVSFQVIEHVDDAAGFVAELGRVLEPGGVLYLTTPNRLLRLGPGDAPWNRYHVREYDPAEFEALLEPVFDEVRVLGVRGTDEVERIERERLHAIRRIVRYDPFNLRNRLPERLKQVLMRWAEKRSPSEQPADDTDGFDRFGVDDFRASDVGVEASLDLLAVCRSAG